MNIYPAIDLQSGRCVRLYQGRYDKCTVYDEDPMLLAQSFVAQGANTIHIVDLDGAKQATPVNTKVIIDIKQKTGACIQTGGGIRSKQQIMQLLELGIDRIIIGSLAIIETHEVKQWIIEFGREHIVLAFDIRYNQQQLPQVALHGWQAMSEKILWDVLDEYQDCGLQHILCTDIAKDGTLQGPNLQLYKSCVTRYPSLKFQASGGVSHLNDLASLASIPMDSCIVGKALYEKNFSLKEALRVATYPPSCPSV